MTVRELFRLMMGSPRVEICVGSREWEHETPIYEGPILNTSTALLDRTVLYFKVAPVVNDGFAVVKTRVVVK